MSVIAAPVPMILKGPTFAQRLEEVCQAGLGDVHPIGHLKYRNILIPHLVGGELPFALHGFIGQALRMRGAAVTALLCDAFLPACVCRKVDHYESACTRWCHAHAGPFAEALQLPHRWHSRFITAEEKRACDRQVEATSAESLPTLKQEGLDLGPLIVQSVQSYYRVGRYDPSSAEMVATAREFLRSALYVSIIAERAFRDLAIDKIVTDCGQQVEWGVFRAVAGRYGIPVDVINVGLRGNALKLETDRPGGPTRQVPGWDAWRDLPLTPEQNRALDRYLARREKVPYEFKDERWQGRITDADEVRETIGLPAEFESRVQSGECCSSTHHSQLATRTPGVFALFPNVGFDAGKTRTRAAFECAADWVIETIRYFASRPAHHLVVKVHPGELHRAALDPVMDLIRRECPRLPPNVHVIPPETGVTAHGVLRLADAALVYTSTVAAEAVGLGKPVVLVGGGRHSGHGVTVDVEDPRAYFTLLDDLCEGRRTLESPGELGRRYAYAVFFRADIPINHFRMLDIYVGDLTVERLSDLAPGRDACMDALCRGILLDESFENPHALHPEAGTSAR